MYIKKNKQLRSKFSCSTSKMQIPQSFISSVSKSPKQPCKLSTTVQSKFIVYVSIPFFRNQWIKKAFFSPC